MAINMMCQNYECKFYFEDNCMKNLNEERLVLDSNGKCETFEKGKNEAYNITVHELKTFPEYFLPMNLGNKTFEVRKNDRDFKIGDILQLREWDGKKYTGKYTYREITYTFDLLV